jgi:excisionase family DNA binding protein
VATPKAIGEVLKIYTASEIADQLNVDYKTVLNLIKRGLLKALPGIRHKRITEAELNRYLGIQNPAAITPAPAKPVCNSPATLPTRPAVQVVIKDKSLVSPTAKAVASPVAQTSQRKINETS